MSENLRKPIKNIYPFHSNKEAQTASRTSRWYYKKDYPGGLGSNYWDVDED